jgi:NTP pyrophosphatase (non-canonical NTP hydrolase)
MDIKELQLASHAISVVHGWWEGFPEGPDTTGLKLALIHSEVSEALEEWRAGHAYTEVYYNTPDVLKPEGFPTELADIMIRVADMAEGYGIDLNEVIKIKMAYNATRPYKHGKLA